MAVAVLLPLPISIAVHKAAHLESVAEWVKLRERVLTLAVLFVVGVFLLWRDANCLLAYHRPRRTAGRYGASPAAPPES